MAGRGRGRWWGAVVAAAAAGGCGPSPPADNAAIQTPDDKPIGPPRFQRPGVGPTKPVIAGGSGAPVAGEKVKVGKPR